MSSAICFSWDQSKILSSGNGLKQHIPVNSLLHILIHVVKTNRNTDGRRENAGKQHFLLSHFVFHPYKNNVHFYSHL